jgi:hypothetical protein
LLKKEFKMDHQAPNLATSQPATHPASEDKERGDETNFALFHPPASKGYRTQNPKTDSSDNESEGESENEDPSVIWRGLTQSDINNLEQGKGLVAATTKTGALLYGEIKEHVENGSKPEHRCGLMSATRSKKVAARYSSHKVPGAPEPTRRLAKIKLDLATNGSIDLTEPAERAKAGLAGKVEKFANNSQEVIICSSISQENIMGIYRVQEFWLNKVNAKGEENNKAQQIEAQYQQARKSDKNASFVKFRAYERDAYYGFSIKAEKSEDYFPKACEQKSGIKADKILRTPSTLGDKNPIKKEAEIPQSPSVSKNLIKKFEAVSLSFATLTAKSSQKLEVPPSSTINSVASVSKREVPTALGATANKLDVKQSSLPVSPKFIPFHARKHRNSDSTTRF